MKEYVIPYVVGKNGEWWAGIDIYNPSNEENSITIEIFRYSNGVVSSSKEVVIGANGHHLLVPDDINKNLNEDEGRATIKIVGNDKLFITPFQGTGVGAFGILPVFEETEIKN